MNLVYTIDRMRIWGGSWITMSSIYGDILHPFLDWYLINPVFSFPPNQLKNGKYQKKKIIEHFAPSLKSLPINATSQLDYRYRMMKNKLEKNIKRNDQLKVIAKKIHSLTKSTVDEQLDTVADNDEWDNIDENIFTDLGIDISILQNSADITEFSRVSSVIAFHNYVKRNQLEVFK